MHKVPEFQAVVLAAGRGSRLPHVGGVVTKCLLPVGPRPAIWYSLHMLEKLGFQGRYLLHEHFLLFLLKKIPFTVSK